MIVLTRARGCSDADVFVVVAYLDALRRPRLPAALIQGLRDNFGAHTYQRVDKDGTFHTMWAEDLREVSA